VPRSPWRTGRWSNAQFGLILLAAALASVIAGVALAAVDASPIVLVLIALGIAAAAIGIVFGVRPPPRNPPSARR
jgi:membrane associated rhomboid family serine protease